MIFQKQGLNLMLNNGLKFFTCQPAKIQINANLTYRHQLKSNIFKLICPG